MFDLGVVIGKFAPLTLGHINLITEAAVQSKHVLVVLSHDQRWLDKQSPRDQQVLNFKNRLRWLQQTYADTEHVTIDFIDEASVPEYPNGWQEYAALLGAKIFSEAGKLAAKHSQAQSIAIFSSELDYDEKYKTHLGFVEHVIVDSERTRVPISATKVRDNLYANWEYLPSIVRKDYCLRVVVMGVESAGKSNLVKNLAKLYNTSWVEEYGRTYCETVLAGSELTLRSSDYPLIAYRHKELEEEALRTSNRLCFVDTNAFVTEYYHRLYEGKPNPIVSAIAAEEHYDLVLILSPEVPWVDDGLRLNPDREKTDGLFQQMLLEFKNQTPRGRTVFITGDSYKGRLDQARAAVDQLLAFNEGFLGWDAVRKDEPGKFQTAPSDGSITTLIQAMVDSVEDRCHHKSSD
ncbi:nicotinamide-nucleotide adenylyltransferase [Klebsiella phage vB_KpM_FBKp24]|uniref:Multifunctional transcriptional regulator/nicotinamide-nucleotide adenylyltransferase/ribosylnicotinamide kinase n=1 Tax=Klebsiella phage vB_KpM_FBKp24 TaxID=2801834 RepID=A0A7U0J6N0_9CAUD|nr:nicotinamide-nucleotide adenylyltransferase [Klebsiella phage vB_KpM_FBKp24]QQV92066.1 multifunctional transcriptional regulator/nicotinamide-nucleotide adenylyltransferase/ribosylnicotinamide kinase [Klebsiella phage vB_KpM_FBKp24]